MPDFFTGPTCESENLELVRELYRWRQNDPEKEIHAQLARFHPKNGNFSLEIALGPCVCLSPAVATAQNLPRARRPLTRSRV